MKCGDKLNKKKVSEVKGIKNKINQVDIKSNDIVKSKSRPYIGYLSRIVILSLVLIVTVFLTRFFALKAINIDEKKEITYKENGILDYKVNLKENEFYEENNLDKGIVYIASLIKNIDIKLDYRFNIDELTNQKYTYDIKAILKIYEKEENKKLFEKEYKIITNKSKNIYDTKDGYISESLNIDYEYYNGLVSKFKFAYGVDTNSELVVMINIKKDIINNDNSIDIKNERSMQLSIPLSQKTIDIKIEDTNIDETGSIIKADKTTNVNIMYGIASCIMLILMVTLLLKLLRLLFMLKQKKSRYDKYVNRILKEYDRLISETSTKPQTEGIEIIKINKFEELVDVRDNLSLPIMYYSITKHQKSWFYISHNDKIYLHVVKAVDLEEKK